MWAVKTRTDELLFDEMQQALLWALAQEMRTGLRAAKLPDSYVSALTRLLTTRVAGVLDGRRPLNVMGQPVTPVLCFAINRTDLINAGGPSWMSDHAIGTVEALLMEP